MDISIVGGGAAGFFAAIAAAESNPKAQVCIYERGKRVLEKVSISGGGRCNVTHACFDPRSLVQFYPRGSKELLGPFIRFGPSDTISWFEKRGVILKTEADGRMFPITDDSATIVNCLMNAARELGVQVFTGKRIEEITPLPEGRWQILLSPDGKKITSDRLLIAAGSSTAIWQMLAQLGHTIVPPVPSLFTFNTKDGRLRELAGVSVPNVTLQIEGAKLMSEGPLLVTHWGLSGPAILKLSAWGARILQEKNYRFNLIINWLYDKKREDALSWLLEMKDIQGKKQISALAPGALPKRLWQNMLHAAGIAPDIRLADLGKKNMETLAAQLCSSSFGITGKSTFKEEFVTAGGIALSEINFKSFESKLLPGLFAAGEVLDIDALTGGFNFQAAWTGGYIAGTAMAQP